MLGYVTVEKAELKMIEYEIYNAYYCGICKSIGRRFGQIPRMVLSYDAAFLSILLASLEETQDCPKQEHCLVHPVKKKTVISNEAIDYAADVMLILAWHKLMDDARDEGKAYAKAAVKVLGGIYRKLEKRQPDLCRMIEGNLHELTQLERMKCANLDEAAESFSKIMENVLTGYKELSESERRVLSGVGYHLGKWIYLIDALDDVRKDIKSGAYNPLVYRFEYNSSKESPEEFLKRIKEDVRRNLLIYLSEMSKALELLDIKKNRGIIENIAYFGLLRKTETILNQ